MSAKLFFIHNSVFNVSNPLVAAFHIDAGTLTVGMNVHISGNPVPFGRVIRIRRNANMEDLQSIECGHDVVVSIETPRVMDAALDTEFRRRGIDAFANSALAQSGVVG